MSARDELYAYGTAAFDTGVPPVVHEQLTKLIDDVIAERDAQIIAWLGKKAGEYRGLPRSRQENAADAIARMADKLSRGAVRPPVPAKTAAETNEAQQVEPAPQCPEALYSPETDTLRRCIRGPHDWRDWHETERGIQWRHATEEHNSPQLDDPFSKDPWTDVPTP